jgi:hypothetical protein
MYSGNPKPVFPPGCPVWDPFKFQILDQEVTDDEEEDAAEVFYLALTSSLHNKQFRPYTDQRLSRML